MIKQSVLFEYHKICGAHMINYHGYIMPLHYGSQLKEHHIVRNDVGMFDISHMTIVDIYGEETIELLRFILTKDVIKLTLPGQALYSAMLNYKGGIIDDLIIYFIKKNYYRMIVNAVNRKKDLYWLNEHAINLNVKIKIRDDLALISIQGPNANKKIKNIISNKEKKNLENMPGFFSRQIDDLFIATTGYTGEMGYEIALPQEKVINLWHQLITDGVHPAGFGARDTLRLEAGLNLYGNEMDENITPLEANMESTISWTPINRKFIGRNVIEKIKTSHHDQLIGLIMEEKGILRRSMLITIYDINENKINGIITSGTFSPTLGYSIGLARIKAKCVHAIKKKAIVHMRSGNQFVLLTQPFFIRRGKPVINFIGN
ncbi:MAG: glycine cleavage system aminomethyltransferase GcvT [Candidatus Dasytiphilus stammeri]